MSDQDKSKPGPSAPANPPDSSAVVPPRTAAPDLTGMGPTKPADKPVETPSSKTAGKTEKSSVDLFFETPPGAPSQPSKPAPKDLPGTAKPVSPSAPVQGSKGAVPARPAPGQSGQPAPQPLWKKILSVFYRFDEPALPATTSPGGTAQNAKSPESGRPASAGPAPSITGGDAASPAGEKLKNLNQKPPVVTFKNVTKTFNVGTKQEYCAIKDISFEIEDLPDVGEFIALVGPSGCGKSTVLNLIQGFPEVWPPTSGEVFVRNMPVTGPGKDRGMIFQKYSSFPNLTVLQNVMFGLEINSRENRMTTAQMRVTSLDMIKKVGLLGHENKYPCQLSGGQQQRVAIARTLVLKPRIILMDEPFSALDEPTRIEMQALITDLWHEVEATVFIVTHSIAEAVYLGDRIFMFSRGPGRLAKQMFIKSADIGKEPGLSPLDVQEGQKFKTYLKDVMQTFLQVEQK